MIQLVDFRFEASAVALEVVNALTEGGLGRLGDLGRFREREMVGDDGAEEERGEVERGRHLAVGLVRPKPVLELALERGDLIDRSLLRRDSEHARLEPAGFLRPPLGGVFTAGHHATGAVDFHEQVVWEIILDEGCAGRAGGTARCGKARAGARAAGEVYPDLADGRAGEFLAAEGT